MDSTKFVQKYNRNKQIKRENDDFFLSKSDIDMVKTFKVKIMRLYSIDIQFDMEVKEDDGQWINLIGEHEDRRNVKNYIKAMCSPGERKKVRFASESCVDLMKPEFLEYVEKSTNAFIRPLMNVAEFEISGTELAVTLALSQLEEHVGSAVEDKDMKTNVKDNVKTTNESDPNNISEIITISPASQVSSSRLTTSLQRALSENSDGTCSADDYKGTKASIQRVLVSCLQNVEDDIDDDLLFADGTSEKTNLTTELKSLKIYSRDDDETNQPGTGDLVHATYKDFINDQQYKLINTPTAKLTKEQQELRNFGLGLGYEVAVVDDAVKSANEKMRPSDFIDLLSFFNIQKATDMNNVIDLTNDDDVSDHSIHSDSDVEILETQTIEYTDSKESSPIITRLTGAEAAKAEGLGGSGGSKLTSDYFEKLLQDSNQENDVSIEEMKRRSEERQALLMQDLKHRPPPGVEHQGAKKKRGKGKKKKQKGTDAQSDTSATQSSANDTEQTCVLRVWPYHNSGENKGAENVVGAAAGYDPIQLNPWKKTPGYRGNQPTNLPPLCAFPPSQMPKSPYKHQAAHHKQGQQLGMQQNPRFLSPGKGTDSKPTQVVNPVNVNPNSPQPSNTEPTNPNDLRYIVIDGSNVAMTHGNGKFSCRGIRICVDYFRARGHIDITVFVPNWRTCRPSETNQIFDQNILSELKDEGYLVFTPARRIGRKMVAAYDDRFVLELAEAENAVIVSNDQYRDLMTEKALWKTIIEERLLMYSFVRDRFMVPHYPPVKGNPSLEDFLRHSPVGKRQQQCTGNFPPQPYYKQQQHQQQPYQQQQYQPNQPSHNTPGEGFGGQSHKFKGQGSQGLFEGKVDRSNQETETLLRKLLTIFPDPQHEKILRQVLSNHSAERDVERLSNYCINVLFG